MISFRGELYVASLTTILFLKTLQKLLDFILS